jgi:uncharacterized membrane protein YebE (DUF533 family)
MKVNVKTFVGVGAGLIAGYFLIKSKKPLYIIGTGLAGGILANLVFNKDEKKQIVESSEKRVLEKEEEISEYIPTENSNQREPFVIGSITETSPKDYFDIDLSV